MPEQTITLPARPAHRRRHRQKHAPVLVPTTPSASAPRPPSGKERPPMAWLHDQARHGPHAYATGTPTSLHGKPLTQRGTVEA